MLVSEIYIFDVKIMNNYQNKNIPVTRATYLDFLELLKLIRLV